MENGKYTTIVADPPWRYNDKLRMGVKKDGTPQKGHRGAESHYPCMSLEDIKALDVKSLAADNSHLYLWTTNAFMVEAHELAKEWGFTPRTILTWVKPYFGMGHYYRNATEHVLFCVRGKLPLNNHNTINWFVEKRGKHSQKPEKFYEIVEKCSPGPYLELFSRQPREGWHVWGNEVESDISILTVK